METVMQEKGHRLLGYALEILDRIADSPVPLSLKDIQTLFPISRSTVYNLVQALSIRGYIEKDPGDNFCIGIRCFRTGNAFRTANPFNSRIRPIIEEVNRASKETTHFAILNGTQVVYLYKFDSAHAIRIHSEVGKAIPAHTTAIGKAILSCFSDEEILALYPDKKLPAMTSKSITSFNVLLKQLQEIRSVSIAFEQEESTPYVKCLAVPILNSQYLPAAGLSIAFPVYWDDSKTKKLIPLLLEAKKKLEALNSLYE
jgi:DNA-binding IclR family transcriptional regulator